MKISSLLITLLRVFLGTILLLAGAAKVTEFRAFVGHVALYGILPMSFVTSASYLLVSAEITVGAALVLGYFSRGAGLLAALLFLTFALALASALWRELPLDECGCAANCVATEGRRYITQFFSQNSSLRYYKP